MNAHPIPKRALTLILALAASSLACAQPPVKDGKAARQIFVLHDGYHTILSNPRPTWATEDMRNYLLKHGVDDRDIIMMDCPFPRASLQDMFPREGFEFFLHSMQPSSKASQQTYTRLHWALRDRGVRPEDKLIWIGHSAGGQIGMTMAHLGSSLGKYPDLARTTTPHPFDMVVTLGTPLGTDFLPDTVKQRHYYSPQDRVVHLMCVYGTMALWLSDYKDLNVEFMPIPHRLSPNGVARIFHDIEHPYWPKDERIFIRILDEYRKDYRPAWRSCPVTAGMGAGMSGLLCQALEEQCRLSIEDPFEEKHN